MRAAAAASAAAVVALVLSSCGVRAGEQALPRDRAADRTAPATALPATPEAAGEASVALVSTPFSTGSGVLMGDGYLVTNSHVVDPFDQAVVTFADGERHRSVPVTGVDLTADLAVLGPIDTDHPPLEVADPDELTSGDDISLVGFPGDQDDEDPDLHVEAGRYARHQYPKNWDLDYLQANVDIQDGQSGGALVDDRGRLVGISALSLDDGVALSLSVDDVEPIAEGLRGGSADGPAGDWTPVPHTQGDVLHHVTFDGPDDIAAFYVSGAVGADHIEMISSDPDARVMVFEPGFFPTEATKPALAASDRAEGLWSFAAGNDVDVIDLDAAGAATVDVDEGEERIILVGSDSAEPVRFATYPASAEVEVVPSPTPIAVGDSVVDAVGYLDAVDVYELDLEKGQEVAIDAESASGDLAFVFARPGEPWGSADAYDETGSPNAGPGGMLGLDEHGVIAAEEAGRYSIVVYAADGVPTTYRLSVSEP